MIESIDWSSINL